MSDLVENPEDRFSQNEAQIRQMSAECHVGKENKVSILVRSLQFFMLLSPIISQSNGLMDT